MNFLFIKKMMINSEMVDQRTHVNPSSANPSKGLSALKQFAGSVADEFFECV